MILNVIFGILLAIASLLFFVMAVVMFREYVWEAGLPLVLFAILFAVLCYPVFKSAYIPIEKQYAEKKQAVIDVQKDLDKFLIDYPEFNESEE